jgi:hypothetical protein
MICDLSEGIQFAQGDLSQFDEDDRDGRIERGRDGRVHMIEVAHTYGINSTLPHNTEDFGIDTSQLPSAGLILRVSSSPDGRFHSGSSSRSSDA